MLQFRHAPVSFPAPPTLLAPGKWMKRTLRAEELSRDVESLAADNNDSLALEELLGDGGSQTTKKMALAINGDLYRESTLASCPPFVHRSI